MLFKSFRALRNRHYALLWSTGLVSDTGTWMQTVTVGILITDITGKASWGGLAAALGFLTSGIVTPFGGAIADRHDRRRLLLLAGMAQACVALALATVYVTGHISPLAMVSIVALEGCLNALALPARTAMMPDLVGKDLLVDATSLGIVSWNLGRTVGPGLAGLVIAYGTYTWVFVINACSFLLVAFALLFVKVPKLKHDSSALQAKVFERMREGFWAARNDVGCWHAIKAIAVTALLISPFIALIPAMSQLVLGGNGVDTAHLVMAQGLGSIVGAFVVPSLVTRFGHNAVLRSALLGLPVLTIPYAFAPNINIALFLLCGLGACYAAVLVGLSATLQLRSPAVLRARVVSLFMTTLGIFYFLGSTIQGYLGDVVGIRNVSCACAGIYLLVLLFAYVRLAEGVRSLGPIAEVPAP